MAAGTNELFGDIQGVDKTAAYRLHVEGHGAVIAKFCLQQAGRTWEDEIRGRGGNDDQIKFAGINSSRCKCLAAGFKRQIT